MDGSHVLKCNEEPLSIILSSADRTTGSTYAEGTILLKRKIIGCRKLMLVSSNVPNTAYVLNGVPFVFQEQAGGAPVMTVTITGSYTGNSLALYLQSQMTAASAATGNTYTYTVTYDSDTGKMTYTETSAGANFRIVSTTTNFPAYRLGFSSTANTAYAATITSPNLIDLSAPKYAILAITGLAKDGQVITGGEREITGHFILPLGSQSFNIGEYFQKSTYDSWVRITMSDNFTAFHYRFFDAETKVLMPLQANWVIQLRAE